MSKLSFKEFDSVSSKAWKQKIQFDLKGADYNKTLLSSTLEDITINPFYHQDQTKYLEVKMPEKPFKIGQTIFIDDENIANKLALKALENGVNALNFKANEPFDIDLLLKNLSNKNKSIPLYFELNFLSKSFAIELLNKTKQFEVFLNCDIIGHLAQTGNWFKNNKSDHQQLETIINFNPNHASILGVDAQIYQNAGANAVQQIAYALAHVNEYFNAFADDESNLKNKIQVNFAVGGQYFMEIAKLRAFRYLFDLISREYPVKVELELLAVPSLRNKSIYDYNVNMLRTTTECMSAILGGADVICNVPYDSIFHKSNAFGDRIARNQLLILKDESYFNEAREVVKGTYYIEELSAKLAEKALTIFKEIEKKGGFVSQLIGGIIQRKITENAAKEQKLFDSGELQFIGVNKFPNDKDTMSESLELYPFLKIKARKTLIQPILAKRLAEKLEQNRLANETKKQF